MDIDFYGYQRETPGKFLLSSDYASVYFNGASGAAKAGLVQNCSVSYQHNVQARFETGSSELFWLSGQSIGDLQIARLVGDRGILDGINQATAGPNDLKKGVLGGIEVKLGRNNSVGVVMSQEVLCLRGCVLTGVGLNFGVGGFDVQESLSIRAAFIKKAV